MWKMIQKSKKPLIKKDFARAGMSYRAVESNLFLLEKLGLIETVEVYYKFGRYMQCRRGVKGYVKKNKNGNR